jgi:acyl-CoA dehydrogenase
MQFVAPLDAIAFTLRKIADFDDLLILGAFPELDWDTTKGVLDEAARFAQSRLLPLDKAGDRIGARFANGQVVMPEGFVQTYREWAAGGWNAVGLPAEYGGMGLPAALSTAIMEMWTSGCYSLAMGAVLAQTASEVLIASASAELKAKWLEPLVTGEWTATMAMTESQAGSDVGALMTRAQPADDGSYLITGSKIFISFGEHDLTQNILHLVLARLPGAPDGLAGVSMFLVPKRLTGFGGLPGALNAVVCTGIEHKLGLRASPTCSLNFQGAKGWLVGEPNKGLAGMFRMMNRMRLTTGIQGVAIAEKASQQALAYALERRQGRSVTVPNNSPIIEHPDVLRMILTMQAQTAGLRALAYTAAQAIDRAETHQDPAMRAAASARASLLTPVVKAHCADVAFDVASLNIQVHGGMGYVEETGAAQLLRDIRVASIYEGTNTIQANDLVLRKVLKDQGAEVRKLMAECHGIARRTEWSPGMIGALSALEQATAWVLTNGDDLRSVQASASAYLKTLGIVICGTLLAKGALAADDDPIGRTFAGLAEFYAANILPHALAQAQIVMEGSASILAGRTILPPEGP